MLRFLAVFLVCAGIFCLAQSNAQVPMTGAGLGAPAGAVAGYTGPGDCSGCLTTYTLWYGLSAFSAATTGTKSVNVCNTVPLCADVNTLSNGKFDVATATGGTLHCGGVGGQCTIAVLYDKSGNGNDCTISSGNNPLITFNALGSFPSLNFNTTSRGFCVSGSAVNMTTPTTFVGVIASNSADNAVFSLFNPGLDPGFESTSSGTVIGLFDSAFATPITASITPGTFYVESGVWNTSSSALYLNGAATTGTLAASPNNQPIRVGDGTFLGQMFEVGVQAGSAVNSTQASAYSANRRAFYGN